MRRSRAPPSSSSSAAASSASAVPATVAASLKELHQLVLQIQEDRTRGEHNLVNISKTHERMKSEPKVSPYFKTKLRGLYNTATSDAETEADLIKKALDKIASIKAVRSGHKGFSEEPRKAGMRRGVLMTILQQAASQLPMFMGKAGETAPPLCGGLAAETSYIAEAGDHVAARVKSQEGEEQWILAEIVSYNHMSNKYDVDDIDEEGRNGKERHHLSRRRIVALPKMKANPLTHPDALFQEGTLVMALYPQTTCFYRALIHQPPQRPQDDYSVLFEDTSYPDGYSPPLNVPQRYVVTVKETKRR